jgi:hypothetical protein
MAKSIKVRMILMLIVALLRIISSIQTIATGEKDLEGNV